MGLTDLLAIIDSLVKKEGLAGGSEGKEEFSIEKGKNRRRSVQTVKFNR